MPKPLKHKQLQELIELQINTSLQISKIIGKDTSYAMLQEIMRCQTFDLIDWVRMNNNQKQQINHNLSISFDNSKIDSMEQDIEKQSIVLSSLPPQPPIYAEAN